MSDMRQGTGKSFAERQREAVNDSPATKAREGRHAHRRVTRPLSSPLANPARFTYSDELFVDRVRKAIGRQD